MLKNEREREILHVLGAREGFVSVRELCGALYASESSIRRDLAALEAAGAIRRTHGGAALITGASNVIAFSQRSHHNAAAKKAIAAKAAGLVRDGAVVFLDQSSTAFYLACELAGNHSLTVVTNNVEILALLSASGMRVLCSGGYLSHENRNCLLGGDASYIFEHMRADMAFFSTKALADDGTVSDCTREEVIVRRAMLTHAERRVFLCDSSKFGASAPYRQCSLRDVDVLISEGETAQRFADIAPHLMSL